MHGASPNRPRKLSILSQAIAWEEQTDQRSDFAGFVATTIPRIVGPIGNVDANVF